MNRKETFFRNAVLLTLTSFLLRGVGLAFNVWISNKVGAEALGLFTLISSVYGFALTIATSGIALAVTRMVAEALGHDDDGLVRASLKRCTLYALFFGILASALLFTMSGIIGNSWLKDSRTVFPLRLMSVTLPVIALCSAMNGYFTAVRRVVKNAVSQIIEQAVKIGITVILLTAIFPDGIENACIALILGGLVSELLSFVIMSFMYIFDRRKYISKGSPVTDGHAVTKTLLGIALPVAFTTYVRSGLLAVEHALIPIGLRKSGETQGNSLAAYGRLTGMAFPVIMFPMALITSFAGMTVPELSDCLARGHKNRVRYIAGRVWQFSLIFSVGVAGIIGCFSDELGTVLYNSPEAALYIRLLAPLLPVMYLDNTTDALLKGLGQQFYSMNVNIIDALISVVLVWLLTPKYGINGYIFVIIAMEILNFGLSAVRMLSLSAMKPKLFSWLFKPIVCILGATWTSNLIFRYIPTFFIPNWLALILHITVAALLYILLLSLTRTLGKDDKEWFIGIFRHKDHKGSDA